MNSTAENIDCMIGMSRYPDKYFELAIVDPPYGLDKRLSSGGGQHKNSKFRLQYLNQKWDVKPNAEYFNELFRVSKNQIIWGGNYFELPATRGVCAWDKKQMMPTFSRWEYAWTSFDCPAKMFECSEIDINKFHPTQKPVKLYKWLLDKYAKQGDKILDTHLGSGSSRIACYDYGFDFIGFELDKDYFEAQEKRFKDHTSQTNMFK